MLSVNEVRRIVICIVFFSFFLIIFLHKGHFNSSSLWKRFSMQREQNLWLNLTVIILFYLQDKEIGFLYGSKQIGQIWLSSHCSFSILSESMLFGIIGLMLFIVLLFIFATENISWSFVFLEVILISGFFIFYFNSFKILSSVRLLIIRKWVWIIF